MRPRLISLLGRNVLATQALAQALAGRLNASGLDAECLIDDPWQVFVQQHGRAPDQLEVQALLSMHAAASERAEQAGAVLILAWPLLPLALCLDESPIGQHWKDRALAQLRQAMVNVLLPAEAFGHGAEPLSPGTHADMLRPALHSAGLPYVAVTGATATQADQAMMSIEHALDTPGRLVRAAAGPRWRWLCERCDDGACEHDSKA